MQCSIAIIGVDKLPGTKRAIKVAIGKCHGICLGTQLHLVRALRQQLMSNMLMSVVLRRCCARRVNPVRLRHGAGVKTMGSTKGWRWWVRKKKELGYDAWVYQADKMDPARWGEMKKSVAGCVALES